MLVMPIVNRDRILNVEISLKPVKKVKQNVKFDDVIPSDIIVSYAPFSKSSYNTKNVSAAEVTEFIRHNNIMSKADYFVSTKNNVDSNLYDIYQIVTPPLKVSRGLDSLYGSLILDLKNEVPNNIKGRYLDLSKLGVVDHITEDRLGKLTFIANGEVDDYSKKIEENDLHDLIDTLKFLELFECNVIRKTTIKQEEFESVLRCMNATNSKASHELNRYYEIAKANKEAYSKISRLYNIIYNDKLDWIHKDKIKIKNNKEVQPYKSVS